ncbi:hypothetical protein Anas_10676 [Armadillidium nasatum]|uniref:Uncharacterized protein n=1 Tax=Armadillidium nasatum TaxID=96803 RepID=A0A5N5SRJ2_9CRUS|nr:hypothetical protein Anas_10676 [Armadillidium nasatum]
MKTLALILCSFVLILGANCQNIPVRTSYGTAFVEPDELIERALQVELRPRGIIDVDVDREHNTAFKIEIKSIGMLGFDFENTLQNVLRSNLGLSSASVRVKDPWSRELFDDEMKYYVYLNPRSSRRELEALAQKTMQTSYLKLDNDPW